MIDILFYCAAVVAIGYSAVALGGNAGLFLFIGLFSLVSFRRRPMRNLGPELNAREQIIVQLICARLAKGEDESYVGVEMYESACRVADSLLGKFQK